MRWQQKYLRLLFKGDITGKSIKIYAILLGTAEEL
jgi:hypothetical protein